MRSASERARRRRRKLSKETESKEADFGTSGELSRDPSSQLDGPAASSGELAPAGPEDRRCDSEASEAPDSWERPRREKDETPWGQKCLSQEEVRANLEKARQDSGSSYKQGTSYWWQDD